MFAERALMPRSAPVGALIEPPTALLMYMRFSRPVTQRTPWPNATPLGLTAVPCSTMLAALGRWPLVTSLRPSADMRAPPVFELLLQPTPLPAGGFAHGQPRTPLAPGSQTETPFSSACGRTMTQPPEGVPGAWNPPPVPQIALPSGLIDVG